MSGVGGLPRVPSLPPCMCFLDQETDLGEGPS